MRIAVVGTSNSLMKYGYTYAVARSPRVTSFRNMSIGKSTSLLFALTTDGVDFSEFDFCIFDFAVNEEVFVRHGVTRDEMRSFGLSLAARAWKAGCLPVMLILPRRSVLRERSNIRDHYLSLARDLNAPFFDVIEYAETLERTRGIARGDMFQDDGHLAEWFAIAVGQQLLDGLSRLMQLRDGAAAEPWWHFDYRPVAIAPLLPGGEAAVRRENSLFRLDFARLRPALALSLELPRGSRVAGLYANLATTAGFLRLSGATTEIVDLRNAYQHQGRDKFVLSTVALQRQVAEMGGEIQIEVVAEGDLSAEMRRAVLVGIPEREKPPDLGHVEIGGLIIRSAEPERVAHRPSPSLNLSIERMTSSAAVDTAIDIYASHTVARRR